MFLRQTDLDIFPLYPTSNRRDIMSSMSSVGVPGVMDVVRAAGEPTEESPSPLPPLSGLERMVVMDEARSPLLLLLLLGEEEESGGLRREEPPFVADDGSSEGEGKGDEGECAEPRGACALGTGIPSPFVPT